MRNRFVFDIYRAYTQLETDFGTGSIILYYYSDHRSVTGSYSGSIGRYIIRIPTYCIGTIYYIVIARILCIIYRQKSLRLETSFSIFQKTNLRIIYGLSLYILNNINTTNSNPNKLLEVFSFFLDVQFKILINMCRLQ